MDSKSIRYFAFGGGGTRGTAYGAAIHEWIQLTKYNPTLLLKGCVGTSIGALFAAAMVVGLPPDKILAITKQTNLVDIVNIDITNLWSHWGFDNGGSIVSWIEQFIGSQTFMEMYESTGRILEVVVTNLNTGEVEYLSYKNVPNMKVSTGVSISMCLPPVFSPKKIGANLYIDGGLLDNFPIKRFPAEETLGFRVKWGHVPQLNTFEHYFSRAMYCATVVGTVHQYNALSEEYKNKSITIDCGDVATINWRIPAQTLHQLLSRGRMAVRQFVLDKNVMSCNNSQTLKATNTIGTQTMRSMDTQTS